MSSIKRCPQCGSELETGSSCAEHLYDAFFDADSTRAEQMRAVARFALTHPATHSPRCLQIARCFLSGTEDVEDFLASGVDERGNAVEPTGERSAWHRFASRGPAH